MAFVIIEPVIGKQKGKVDVIPFLTVRPKTAMLGFNSAVISLLGLEEQKTVSFLWNDEDKAFYMSKGIGSKAYNLRVKHHSKSGKVSEAVIGNNDLVLRLRDIYSNDDSNAFRLHVAPEPIQHMGDNLLYKLIKQQEG